MALARAFVLAELATAPAGLVLTVVAGRRHVMADSDEVAEARERAAHRAEEKDRHVAPSAGGRW